MGGCTARHTATEKELVLERRTFLQWLVTGAAAWPIRGVRLHAQAAQLPAASMATLRALGGAVLPGELTAAGHDSVVADFVQWLASYRPGAERGWGYGHPRRAVTPAVDARQYATQLDELERQAQASGGTLASLSVDARRELVARNLTSANVRALPGAPNGAHVITDFMAFYFGSAAAVDRVYRARIGRATCRGLSGAANRPQAIAGD